MSRGQTLRALVTERLTAAADEIFVLFERTIAEYEEELSRSKENRSVSPKGPHPAAQTLPCPELPVRIKEEPAEHSVKEEEEQLPVFAPESSSVCVKKEEFSPLQQTQTEPQEGTRGENIHSETRFHSETAGHTEQSSDTDNDDDWNPQYSSSVVQMEVEVQTSDGATAARNSYLSPKFMYELDTGAFGNDGNTSRAERKQQCPFCQKIFTSNANLQVHLRNHIGERPYSCSVCQRTCAHKNIHIDHRRMHMLEKPFSCSLCRKTFAHSSALDAHMRVHTGEKPFSCPLCAKTFVQRSSLDKHLRIHRGEKPYSCSVCQKPFGQKSDLNAHMRIHTGERPYSCSICNKDFAVKSNLYRHMGTHSGKKSVAKSGFSA